MKARRQAGLHRRIRPATVSPPDPRPGRRRTRLSLLPAIALLLAAFGLFAAAPAQAQQTQAPPTNLIVTPGDGQLTLWWTAPSGATDYLVQYNASSTGGDWVGVSDSAITQTTYTITGLTNGRSYRVRIAAYRGVSILSTYVVSSGTPNPVPTQDTTVWSGTLTVGEASAAHLLGCWNSGSSSTQCTSALSDDDFTHNGVDNVINILWAQTRSGGDVTLTMRLNNNVPTDLQSFASLYVGSRQFFFSADENSAANRLMWRDSGVSWSVGDTVSLRIVLHPPITASLQVAPNPVTEGSSVRVAATVSRALSSDVNLPVTLTPGTALRLHDFGTLTGILIPAGSTSGFGFITTRPDDDANHETFTVALGPKAPVTGVDPSSVQITIRDDERIWEPSNLRVTKGNRTLTLRWNAPTNTKPGDWLAGYSVEYRRSDGGWIKYGDDPGSRETTRVIGIGLLDPDEVHVRVRAKYYRGGSIVDGDWATWPEETAPSASVLPVQTTSIKPFGLRLTWGNHRLTLRWNAPTHTPETGDRLAGYSVQYKWTDGKVAPLWIDHGGRLSRATTRVIDGVTRDTVTNVRVRANYYRSGALAHGDWATWIVDTESPAQTYSPIQLESPGQPTQTGTQPLLAQCASHLPANAVSVAEVTGWRDAHSHDASHVLRWNKVLEALGAETGTDVTPLTVEESKANENRFMRTRWSRVTGTLDGIDACVAAILMAGMLESTSGLTPPQPRQAAPAALHASLITQMNGWRNDPQWVSHKSHTDRWDRALLAFGEPVSDASLTPMTDAEAQDFADTAWGTRWVGVAEALKTVVTGTGSDDTLTGTASGELLVGLAGADALNGEGGNDELRGGSGDDDLSGGAGADRFVFFSNETGANAITDFESGDVVVLKGNGWSSVSDIVDTQQAVGSTGYRYTLAPGVTVESTNNRSLRTEDFVEE